MDTPMADSVQESFDQMPWLRSADKAAMDLALTYAGRIDEALATGAGQEVTKALYLGPHLLNTLKELGGTPLSRKGMQSNDPVRGSLASIRASLPASHHGKDHPEDMDPTAS